MERKSILGCIVDWLDIIKPKMPVSMRERYYFLVIDGKPIPRVSRLTCDHFDVEERFCVTPDGELRIAPVQVNHWSWGDRVPLALTGDRFTLPEVTLEEREYERQQDYEAKLSLNLAGKNEDVFLSAQMKLLEGEPGGCIYKDITGSWVQCPWHTGVAACYKAALLAVLSGDYELNQDLVGLLLSTYLRKSSFVPYPRPRVHKVYFEDVDEEGNHIRFGEDWWYSFDQATAWSFKAWAESGKNPKGRWYHLYHTFRMPERSNRPKGFMWETRIGALRRMESLCVPVLNRKEPGFEYMKLRNPLIERCPILPPQRAMTLGCAGAYTKHGQRLSTNGMMVANSRRLKNEKSQDRVALPAPKVVSPRVVHNEWEASAWWRATTRTVAGWYFNQMDLDSRMEFLGCDCVREKCIWSMLTIEHEGQVYLKPEFLLREHSVGMLADIASFLIDDMGLNVLHHDDEETLDEAMRQVAKDEESLESLGYWEEPGAEDEDEDDPHGEEPLTSISHSHMRAAAREYVLETMRRPSGPVADFSSLVPRLHAKQPRWVANKPKQPNRLPKAWKRKSIQKKWFCMEERDLGLVGSLPPRASRDETYLTKILRESGYWELTKELQKQFWNELPRYEEKKDAPEEGLELLGSERDDHRHKQTWHRQGGISLCWWRNIPLKLNRSYKRPKCVLYISPQMLDRIT